MLKALFLAALAGAQTAPPPAGPCLTRQQASDMALVVTPYLLEGVRTRCADHLDPTAFVMGSGGTEMAARMRAAGATRVDSAIEGFMLFADSDQRPSRNVSRAMLMAGLSNGLADEMLGAMNTASCRDANEIVESLSPLSPEGIGRLLAVIMAMGSRERRPGDPPICPA